MDNGDGGGRTQHQMMRLMIMIRMPMADCPSQVGRSVVISIEYCIRA